jgi:hypothetical protein
MPIAHDPILSLVDALHAAGLEGATAERNAYGNILVRLTPRDTATLGQLLGLGDDPFLPWDLRPHGIRTITCAVTPGGSVLTLTDAHTSRLAELIQQAP